MQRGACMLMSEFRELYGQYRLKYDMGKAVRWSDACYRTPFTERGLVVKHEAVVRLGDTEHRNVDVIYNLCAC